MDVKLVSKLSMRTIKVQPAKHASEKGTPIAVIYGQANGVKEVVDKVRGDIFIALRGTFEAANLETGEVFRSGLLYLPSGIHESIVGLTGKLQDESDYVEFALQVSAVKASNPAGYSYEAKNMIKAQTVDPLDSMRSELIEGKPAAQLEAPKKDGKK